MASDLNLGNDGASLVSRELDDLLLHVRGLVLVRPLLAKRGVTKDELGAHTNELERLRQRLADLIRGQRSSNLTNRRHPEEA
jgi:hypothetical protein